MSTSLRVWTPERDALLRTYYLTEPSAVFAERVGLTAHAVRCRAIKLGINKTPAKNWRPEEMDVLRQHYLHKTAAELSAMLPGRSVNAVNMQLGKSGLFKQLHFRWSPAEDTRIRQHYPGCASARQFAKQLGRSYAALLTRARQLGVQREEAARLVSLQNARKPVAPPVPAPEPVKTSRQPPAKTPLSKKMTKPRVHATQVKKWYHYPINSPEYKAGVAGLYHGKQRVDIVDQCGRIATVYRNV